MTRVVVPEPVMVPPPPEADNRPLVSVSVTVKVSPVVLPVSEMLTPDIASGLPTPTVVEAGAAMTGRPLTVTAIRFGADTLAHQSLAIIVIRLPLEKTSVSLSRPRGAFTRVNVP